MEGQNEQEVNGCKLFLQQGLCQQPLCKIYILFVFLRKYAVTLFIVDEEFSPFKVLFADYNGFPGARLLELRVRMPPEVLMCVCCECCVLSGLYVGLITRPSKSY